MNAAALPCIAGILLSLPATLAAATLYVNADSSAPLAPYTNWGSAARNIQAAIDIAEAGDLVLVNNGVYETGARNVYGMSNRVALTKPLTVTSVGGPEMTIISGSGPSGPLAVRCAYLTNGAVLAGFTLTHGAPESAGDIYQQASCGGAWCESASAMVSNCVLTANDGGFAGGGAFQGTLTHCILSDNSSFLGGGAYASRLEFCTLSNNTARYGGGAYSATLNNCRLVGNVASSAGGGASGGTLNNCALLANTADEGGGGYYSTLNNCTVSGNSAGYAGGASGCLLNNTIIYYNVAPTAENTDADLTYGGLLNACCTTPQPKSGADNFTNAPRFVDLANGDLRLQTNSPCINSGRNLYAYGLSDLGGNPRIKGATVDSGAYEFQFPASVISYAWLQVYGLPTDGSVDSQDTDFDGMNNWQEWMAGTDPTNAASLLRLEAPIDNLPGILLRWSSDTNHAYFIQRADRLRARTPFRSLEGNILGLPDSTAYVDRTAESSNAFYRVGTGRTNGFSAPVLQQPIPVPASTTLTWTSVTNRTYYVERATNLGGPPRFSMLASNIAGSAGITAYDDTNRPQTGLAYYRVGVVR